MPPATIQRPKDNCHLKPLNPLKKELGISRIKIISSADINAVRRVPLIVTPADLLKILITLEICRLG